MNRHPAWGRIGVIIGILALVICSLPSAAQAAVRLEGDWPDEDELVSLDAKQLPRSEAVRRIAEAAGWSLVHHAPGTDPVDLHVKNQPASKVLSMILSDGAYVARRDGTLVVVERDTESSPEVVPVEPMDPVEEPTAEPASEPAASADPVPEPPPAVAKGNPPDRVVSGGKVRVEKGEVVGDVVVFGGSADVLGTATGDVTVVGGSAKIHRGAHVMGDATAVGGSLDVEDGATVDGDVGVVGGVLRRGEEARIGGKAKSGDLHVRASKESGNDEDGFGGWLAGVFSSIGRAIAGAALLFVLGSVLLALGTRRMDALQVELAARPMRSFALGVVGSIVFVLLFAALLISLVGIPVAFIGGLLAVVGAYAGVCAVLTVVGGALLRHRTRNPYVHLALGCTLFLVAKALPFVGHVVFLVVLLLGVGALVATRAAGFIPPGRSKRA